MKIVPNIKLRKLLFVFLGVVFLVTVIGTACDHVSLSLAPSLAQSSLAVNEICTDPPAPTLTPIKILFLIDMSGSNCTQENLPPACDSSGTDSNKAYRAGLMQNFVQTHQAETNISYGLITFSGTTATALINDGSTTDPIFTNNQTQIASAFATFMATPDSGATPYNAALTMANRAITVDVSNSTQKANYFIVIVSDGMPTDYGYPPNQVQINADVKSLITAAAGQATLSSIYYNQLNVAGDIAVLQGMASAGGGGFSNTNIQGRDVPLEEILALSNSYPWVITQMVVTNLNAAPCDDGTMGADSDADGICDKDELTYNTTFAQDPILSARMNGNTFDPQNRNSFNPSYGDLFYYRKILYGQSIDPSCVLTGNIADDDADHDLLNTCEEEFIASNTPVGPTTLWSGAMGKVADPFNFDSDGDGFTDWLEFAYTRSLAGAMDFTSPQDLQQGVSNFKILTQHLNPLNPTSSPAYDGVLKFSKTNDQGQNCYTYQQTILPLYPTLPVTTAQVSNFPQLAHGSNQNIILIYFIEKPENAMNGPGVFKYFYQNVGTNINGVTLNLDSSQYGTYSPDQSLVSTAIRNASEGD